LASLPNGDLLVATSGSTVALLPFAESPTGALTAHTFATIADAPDSGVAFSPSLCKIFVGTQHGVYAIPYAYGDQTARSTTQIASVRTGSPPAGSDGDVHSTTSVAYSEVTNILSVAVGSSCNACTETDNTRASIFQMTGAGTGMSKRATRIRNGIALTTNPSSGSVWVGDAGQDDLPSGHPYEFVDNLSSHGGVADYGWPDCEENNVAYTAGAQCAATVAPLIEFPAYSTIVGAVFYPAQAGLQYGFPVAYRGGLFVTRHGSWHTPGGCNVIPEVDFLPMNGDVPATPVNWNDPTKQWQPFVTGFQPGCAASTRIGRPTGVTVSASGTLFIADDLSGAIYRIRP
jgi:glucose/arabinose dehydrogenase